MNILRPVLVLRPILVDHNGLPLSISAWNASFMLVSPMQLDNGANHLNCMYDPRVQTYNLVRTSDNAYLDDPNILFWIMLQGPTYVWVRDLPIST